MVQEVVSAISCAFDNSVHHSHMSLDFIKLARESNVQLICFPPHCTHILQPLDITVFGPLKAIWRKVLKEHQLTTCAAAVNKGRVSFTSGKTLGTIFNGETLS